jgi:hypothetical protein
MISGINDELILVARLLPSDSISDFRLEKGEGLFGHRKSNGAALRPDARSWLLLWRSSWSFRLRSPSLLARSRVL